jgi:hypothetical protein
VVVWALFVRPFIRTQTGPSFPCVQNAAVTIAVLHAIICEKMKALLADHQSVIMSWVLHSRRSDCVCMTLVIVGAVLGLWILRCPVASAQEESQPKVVSHKLSSYLSLTSQQRQEISRIGAANGPNGENAKHSEALSVLTADQRNKLRTLEFSGGQDTLKAEALSLHLLCKHRPFGGATTKFETSTCVEPGANATAPPSSPPQ